MYKIKWNHIIKWKKNGYTQKDIATKLELVIAVDKKENCKLIDAIYPKNNEPIYTQLHLPRTVLTVLTVQEYMDIINSL